MLITVSGPAGSGKSTLAGTLSEELAFDHVSGGDIFRDIAAERDLTPLELNRLAEEDDAIDRDLDNRLRSIAQEESELVLESRLAGWMAGDYADIRIWLTAPLVVRAERIAEREEKSVATAKEETAARGESEAQRYREYYGIDIDDLSIYDFVVNTARWSPGTVTDLALTAISNYEESGDEGRLPVTDVSYEF